MSEPQTPSGRALMAAFDGREAVWGPEEAEDFILAIEVEARAATLDEVVRVVERLDGIGIVMTGGIANVHEPTRDAILDRIERLRG